MRFAHRAALLVACTLASASALRAADVSEGIEPGTIAPPNVRPVRVGGPRQAELDAGPAWRAFRARYGAWRALWNEVTGTPHRALGPSIPLAGVADDAAAMDRAVRAFVEGNRGIFGTPTLETVAAERAGRVWYVRYRQTLGGVPVLFADWEFRVGENGRLMMFGADAHSPRGMVSTTPTLVRGVAREAATRGLRYRAGIDRVDDGGMWLVPYTTAAGLDYRLAYEERVHVQDPPGNWWTLVDARNGDVLWRQNRVRDDISGHVQGGIHPLLPTDPLSVQSFPNLDVFVGASTAVTNASGNYSAPASGTVAVKDSLFGLYCHVNNVESPAGSFATTATNPATVNITWDLTNSADAERDAFYHVNVVHAFIKGVDPSFTGMDYAVPTTVNINATCNAYWDGTGINFYHAGNGCPNTATIPDVIYHEYGHGINDNVYAAHGSPGGMFNGALHEGMADVNAAFLQDNPDIGKGFFGPGTVLRHLVNTKRWPDDGSGDPHLTGEIISGAFWDLRLAIGLPTALHLEHFAKYGIPDDIDDGIAMSEYFVETLVADDNDADLSNGTPHFSAIVTAFNAHGIGTGFFIQFAHTPLADQTGITGYPVRAVIQYNGPVGALDASTPALHYSINGAPYQALGMAPTGNPDEFGASIPGQRAAIVRYWFSAKDSYGAMNTDPPVAPAGGVYTFIAGPASTAFMQTMESDPGWTVGAPGDAAVTGVWERGNPNGTLVNGQQCAPEDDHTPGSGTVCWVTGLGGPAEDPGLNDVDGGKTTLTTNLFNATAGRYPVLEYYRWYTNDLGASPGEDYWRTLISNDGGVTWVPVENTTQANNSWQRVVFFIDDFVTPTASMRMRFVAQDSLNPSLVEAGVDDFRMLVFPDVAVGDGSPGAALALAPASPNPGPLHTTLRFTLPAAGRAILRVYDLGGRRVRTLVEASLEAGPHAVEWNGRDDSGSRVASGPYFVELAFGGRAAAEKVTIVR